MTQAAAINFVDFRGSLLTGPAKDDSASKRAHTLASLERLALNPGPVATVLKADPNDPDALIEALAHCPALTARVIGVANAAGNNATHRMDTIDRCVRHLGAKQARTVALTLAMQLFAQELRVDQELLDAMWGAATCKAVAAALAVESFQPELAGRAYTLGLLQDIALPVLLAIDPAFFQPDQPIDHDGQAWLDRECGVFGIDHAELGGILLRRWGLSDEFADRIARHHDPVTNKSDADMAAWNLATASMFAALLPHPGQAPDAAQSHQLAALHMRWFSGTHETLEAMLNTIRGRVKAMGKAAGGPESFGPELSQQVADAVAKDTFALVAQVCRLDRQLSQQVDDLANLQRDALTDTLTGLLNRRGFERFAKQMLAQAHKAGMPAMCAMVDLDDFKPINDTFGHAAGDTVIRAAADLLRTNLASGDLVARIGGDEFAILVVGASQGGARAMLERVHAVSNGRRVALDHGRSAVLCMSIGGMFIPHVGRHIGPEELLNAADRLMYRCKQNGKARVSFQALKAAA